MSGDQQEMLGTLFGHLFFFALILGIGIGLSSWLGSRRTDKKFVWWPCVVAAVLALVTLIGIFGSRQVSDQGGSSPSARNDAAIKAEVIRNKIPIGVQLKTDTKSLKLLKNNTIKTIIGVDKSLVGQVTVDVEAIAVSGTTIILQKAWLQNHLINTEILTQKDQEVVGVNCTSSEEAAPKFKGTPCADVADKALGIDVSNIPGDF